MPPSLFVTARLFIHCSFFGNVEGFVHSHPSHSFEEKLKAIRKSCSCILTQHVTNTTKGVLIHDMTQWHNLWSFFSTQQGQVSTLNESDRTSEIYIRAYSFDQPDVIQAAQAALMRGSKVWIVTDGSQTRGSTKQQLQSLKMLRESGGQIRICCGNSVGAAYEEDGRSVKVGGKLRGLHHSKTMLVRFFPDLRKAPPRVTATVANMIHQLRPSQTQDVKRLILSKYLEDYGKEIPSKHVPNSS